MRRLGAGKSARKNEAGILQHAGTSLQYRFGLIGDGLAARIPAGLHGSRHHAAAHAARHRRLPRLPPPRPRPAPPACCCCCSGMGSTEAPSSSLAPPAASIVCRASKKIIRSRTCTHIEDSGVHIKEQVGNGNWARWPKGGSFAGQPTVVRPAGQSGTNSVAQHSTAQHIRA